MGMVDEVFKEFVTWAKNKGRWPLLLLVLIIPAYLVVRWWKGLDSREAVLDAEFWLLTAAILFICGVLLTYTLRAGRRTRWFVPGIMLLAAGVIAVVAVAPPPPPPPGTFVIAIAQFVSVDPDDRHEARVIAYEIARKLEEERDKHDASWVVRRLSREVTGATADERRRTAIEIARARHVNAHLIVWGEVLKDGDRLQIVANTTIAREMESLPKAPDGLRVASAEPSLLSFKDTVTARIVAGVAGLIHYSSRDYRKAIGDFSRSGSNAERIYRGLALYGHSQLVEESRESLLHAIAAYDSVLMSSGSEMERDEALWAARINKANALVALAQGSEDAVAHRQLEAAISIYEFALRSRPRSELLDDWAKLQHNLGNALSILGEGLQGDSAIALLRRSLIVYDSALSTYQDGQHAREFATVLNSRAASMTELGRRLKNGEGDQLLLNAVHAYVTVIAIDGDKLKRSGAQNNRGNALADLGRRARGEDARTYYQQAVSAYRDALSASDSVKPVQRAITQENLGIVLSALAETADGEERRQFLIEAKRQFGAALLVYELRDWQEAQAEVQDSIRAVENRLRETEARVAT
ncbi:MAG: hypothetical protein AB1941_22430 [Gemmatimonadota bacterium]